MVNGEGDIALMKQLLDSMIAATDKLKSAKTSGKSEEVKKIKDLILKIQARVKEELS